MRCLISMLAVCTALVRVYEVYEMLAVKLNFTSVKLKLKISYNPSLNFRQLPRVVFTPSVLGE